MPLTLRIENHANLPDGGPVEVTVDQRGLEAGRDGAMGWTLPDPNRFISSRHFEIRHEGGTWWLHDVSTNGTFVNGASQRVKSPHRLAEGDRLQVGHYRIAVLMGQGATPAARPGPVPGPVPGRHPGADPFAAAPGPPPDPYPGADPFAAAPGAPPGAGGDIWSVGGGAPAGSERFDPVPPPRRRGDFADERVDLPGFAPAPARADPFAAPADPFAAPQTPGAASPFGPAETALPPRPIPRADAASPFAPASPPHSPVSSPALAPSALAPDAASPFGAAPVVQPSMPPGYPAAHPGYAAAQASVPPVYPAAHQGYPAAPPPAPPPAEAFPAAPGPGPAYTPPPPAADASALIEAITAAAGLPPGSLAHAPPEVTAAEIGRALRVVAEDLGALLQTRAAAKQAVRSGKRTMLGAERNNPLKFIATPEEVLSAIFGKPRPGYTHGAEAIRTGFADVKRHEYAVTAALQPALARLLEDLSPEAVEAKAGGGLLSSRKARAWEIFVERWDAKTHPYENGMLDVFLAYFSEAYDQAGGSGK